MRHVRSSPRSLAPRRALAALVLAAVALLAPATARAEPIRLDASLGLSRFQQQAKPRVGTPRGERLVEHNALSVATHGAWRPYRFLALGAFVEADVGQRRSGELAGFDAEGRATIEPAVGGSYAEVWAGLLLRGHWRGAFAEVGYPLLARRWDRGRADLPDERGGTDGALSPILTVRWMAALGGSVPITGCLDLTVRLEWRIRYYDQRDGVDLAGGIVHGTQEIRPLFGLAWRLDG
ncbi:MAG: hypothetical protein R3B48_04550 [Kofleriaceae bacterium]